MVQLNTFGRVALSSVYTIFGVVALVSYMNDPYKTNTLWHIIVFLVFPLLWFYMDYLSGLGFIETSFSFDPNIDNLKSNMFVYTNIVRLIGVFILVAIGTCEDDIEYKSGVCAHEGTAMGVIFILTSIVNIIYLWYAARDQDGVFVVYNTETQRFRWLSIIIIFIRLFSALTALIQAATNAMGSFFVINFIVHILLVPFFTIMFTDNINDRKMEPFMFFHYLYNNEEVNAEAGIGKTRLILSYTLRLIISLYIILNSLLPFANNADDDLQVSNLYNYEFIVRGPSDIYQRFSKLILFAIFVSVTGLEMIQQNTDANLHYGKHTSPDGKGYKSGFYYTAIHLLAKVTFTFYVFMCVIATLQYPGFSDDPMFIQLIAYAVCFVIFLSFLKNIHKAWINFSSDNLYVLVEGDEGEEPDEQFSIRKLCVRIFGLCFDEQNNFEYSYSLTFALVDLAFLIIVFTSASNVTLVTTVSKDPKTWLNLSDSALKGISISNSTLLRTFTYFALYIGITRFFFYTFLMKEYIFDGCSCDSGGVGWSGKSNDSNYEILKFYFGTVNIPLRDVLKDINDSGQVEKYISAAGKRKYRTNARYRSSYTGRRVII